MTREDALAAKARSEARKLRAAARKEELRAMEAALRGEEAISSPSPEPAKADSRRSYNRSIPRHPKRAKSQARPRKRKKRKLAKRGTLKSQIVRLLGLLDRKLNGPDCRLGPECPRPEPHQGDCAYHLWPANSGDAIRFHPKAVVWACSSANYGEYRHRLLYAEKHERRFGKAFMDELRALAKTTKHYTRTELAEMREQLRAQVEAA